MYTLASSTRYFLHLALEPAKAERKQSQNICGRTCHSRRPRPFPNNVGDLLMRTSQQRGATSAGKHVGEQEYRQKTNFAAAASSPAGTANNKRTTKLT